MKKMNKKYYFNEDFDIIFHVNEDNEIIFNEDIGWSRYYLNQLIPQSEEDLNEMIGIVKSAFMAIEVLIQKGEYKKAKKLYYINENAIDQMKTYYENRHYMEMFGLFIDSTDYMLRFLITIGLAVTPIVGQITLLIDMLIKSRKESEMLTIRKPDLKKYAKTLLDASVKECERVKAIGKKAGVILEN